MGRRPGRRAVARWTPRRRAARRAAERAEADAHERRRNRKSVETCDEFAARWPDDYPIVKHGPTRGQRKSDKTLRGYRDELKPFVQDFRGIKLADVDRPMARKFATTRPRSAVVVRNMFSDVDDGLIDANPFANLQLEQARGRSQHPAINEEELHDLGDAAVLVLGGAYGQVYRSFILATGYIGCRLNEGLNLEHRDLRPREREVDLRVTKFSKPRTVLLLPEAWDTIRTIPRQAKHDRVWYARRGGPLTKGNHQSLWTPVRALWWGKLSDTRRRELVDFDWHSLRHFTAHFFYVVRGYGPELAAYQLGHTDPNIVIRRYGKPFQGALDRLKRASDTPRVVPLRPSDAKTREGGRGRSRFRRALGEHMFANSEGTLVATTKKACDMADNSAIEWTEATWNPVTGCSKVSPGCAHCYAETFAERWRGTPGHPYEQGFDLRLWPHRLEQPLRWTRPRMIFVNSMSDLFHEDIPASYIADVFDVMARAEHHTFQVLTKRHERLAELARDLPWPDNVWMGVTIENRRFVHRADYLRGIPAAVRFISAEPLLGPLDGLELADIQWLISGGESGPKHRPVKIEWLRDLRDRCQDKGVAYFFKQWGGPRPKSGGRELDGRTWDEMPASRRPVFA